MEVATEKILALLIMTLVTLLASCLPLLVRQKIIAFAKKELIEKLMSGFLCFGAGIFLATTFIHLMPETRSNVEIAMAKEYISATNLPVAEIIFCGGFFLIYCVEEVLHICVNHRKNDPEPKFRDTRLSSIGVLNLSSLTPEPKPRTHRISSIGALQMNNIPHLEVPHENVTTTSLVVPDIYSHNKLRSTNTIPRNIVKNTVMKSLMIVVALSLHSIMEGVAVGLETESIDMWMIWAAITAHKVIIAFSLGMELLESQFGLSPFLIAMITFSVASPLGGLLGTAALALATQESGPSFVTAMILQGLSGGCILYVTFCEILERERAREHGSLMRLLTLMAGFGIMCGMEFLAAHDHHHHHDQVIDNLHDHV
ncbi:unnamed protein product [Meganyctiphanes norvegica]|uniref:Uncharacterized protein n=1 Tax=Meganyctiphanes norvegica TaxID=48144 RepID=A0AAV2PSW3_MEGNR